MALAECESLLVGNTPMSVCLNPSTSATPENNTAELLLLLLVLVVAAVVLLLVAVVVVLPLVVVLCLRPFAERGGVSAAGACIVRTTTSS